MSWFGQPTGRARPKSKGNHLMRHRSKAALAVVAAASAIVLGGTSAQLAGAAPVRAATAATAVQAATAAAPVAAGKKAKLGMSAPVGLWSQRVREVGSGLQARRIFLGSFTASLKLPTKACRAGMYPVISFKTGSYTWGQVAKGNADAQLRSLSRRLAALPCHVFAAVHHEPAKDGTPRAWSRMQAHALPILGKHKGVKVGVIANGWWWSRGHHRLTKAQIRQWIPRSVIRVSDVIAADTYQSSVTGEEASVKMRRMAHWARNVGGVKALGIGEFNSPTAIGITHAVNRLAAEPLFAWGCVWNTNLGFARVLTGARLTAFRKALAAW
jgi:hypothetical protein